MIHTCNISSNAAKCLTNASNVSGATKLRWKEIVSYHTVKMNILLRHSSVNKIRKLEADTTNVISYVVVVISPIGTYHDFGARFSGEVNVGATNDYLYFNIGLLMLFD